MGTKTSVGCPVNDKRREVIVSTSLHTKGRKRISQHGHFILLPATHTDKLPVGQQIMEVL